MEIIEAYSSSKTQTTDHNEDAWYGSRTVCAVFDAETEKDKNPAQVPTHARRISLELIRAASCIRPDMTPKCVSGHLHAAVKSSDLKGSAVGAIAYLSKDQTATLIRIGDIHIRINQDTYPAQKLLDEITSQARAAYLHALIAQGTSQQSVMEKDCGREMIMPLLKAQEVFANDPVSQYGYPKINGTKTPESMIEVFELRPGDVVTLATDGYDTILDTLEQTEEYLRDSLEKDPLRIKDHPSTKAQVHHSFDDRTYLKFII